MEKLIKGDIALAKKLQGTFRFIDDICVLSDGGKFQKSNKEIYHKELVLKLEHLNLMLHFLILISL